MNEEGEVDSLDESAFILDNYDHADSGLFYAVTRVFGGTGDEPELQFFETGCECSDKTACTLENGCACLKFGNNYRLVEGGGIVLNEIKFGDSPVFECHFRCACFRQLKIARSCRDDWKRVAATFCINRCVQFGPFESLEVFDAGVKGHGLKTKEKIRRGSFICEYAGEVIGLKEAKRRQERQRLASDGMNYVFVLREYSGGSLRCVTCIDPSLVGNIGRYINHSCQPNAAIVPVRVNDSVPWLCVFALRDIQPEEEICYDYSGGSLSSAIDAPPSDRKACRCDSSNCKGYLPFVDL